MTIPAYPTYRVSDLSPDGLLPAHWGQGPIKRLFTVTLGKMVTPSEKTETRLTRPYLRSSNVQDGHLALADTKAMWFSEAETTSLTLLRGDLVVCEGGDVGRCAVLAGDLSGHGFQNSVNRVRARAPFQASTAFLGYWLKTLKTSGFIDTICNRATIAHYTADKLANTIAPFPPPHDQHAIVAFLDRETDKIDALVAEQERLIGLLKEKRQAVISQAVTKGLDPNVLMRGAGVEWLGDVPAHWAVCCLRHHASVENGSTPSRDNPDFWEEGTVPWVTSGEVNQYVITDPSEFITSSALEQSSLRVVPKGAVLVGLVGQGRTRGMSALLSIPAAINQNVAAVVTKPTLLPRYLHYSLQTASDFLRECGRGGNQAALNCEILSAFRIAVPPPEEQAEIVQNLDALHGSITELVEECRQAIALLKERRSALISAAVTGKIDVRGLAPAIQEAA